MSRFLRRFGVLALCAVLLSLAVDWQKAAALLREAELRWLAAALAFLTLQTLLSAERWRITARQLGIRFGIGRAVREYYMAQVINQSLPGGVLGDANRAVRAREQAGLLPSAQAVIFERMAGQLGLLALFLAGVFAGLGVPGVPAGPVWLAPMAAAVLGVALCAGLVAEGILRRVTPVARRARSLGAAFALAICSRPVWPAQIMLSLGTAACNILAFAFCARAIGSVFDPLASLTLVPLILIAMVLPLSIGGWGLREGAAAALFPLWGASAEAGLAASIAFGLTILVSVTPFFLLGWSQRTISADTHTAPQPNDPNHSLIHQPKRTEQ